MYKRITIIAEDHTVLECNAETRADRCCKAHNRYFDCWKCSNCIVCDDYGLPYSCIRYNEVIEKAPSIHAKDKVYCLNYQRQEEIN